MATISGHPYDTPVPDLRSIFSQAVCFDPAGDYEGFLKSIPAKPAVYLMADEGDRPVQLLSVRNLRNSVKRRLSGEESVVGLSKRANLREIVRKVWYRRVDGRFEADWVYLESARALFPESYQGMVGFRAAWFVQIEPGAAFPRWQKTVKVEGASLEAGAGVRFIGPIEDKHAAQRLVEVLEDQFDLCRYYNVLVEAPGGKACAYKEMGRCAAPCDGSVTMEMYRGTVGESVRALVDPEGMRREMEGRMKRAARELQFEAAGGMKKRIEALGQLQKGAYRHARPLEDLVYLVLQPGPREGTGRLFLVTAHAMEEMVGVIGEVGRGSDWLRYALHRAGELQRGSSIMTQAGAEHLGLIAHHLFMPKGKSGVFVLLGEATEGWLAKAWKELQKQKAVEEEDAEGVVKELNNLGGGEEVEGEG